MKKKIWIPLLILAVLVLAVSLRLRPRTLEQVTGLELDHLTGLSGSVTEGGITNGTAYMDHYKTPSLTPEDEEFAALLALAEPLRFRPSLWPFPRDSVASGSAEGFYLHLVSGMDSAWLNIYDNGTIIVSPAEGEGFLVYYLTDLELYEPLFSYIKTHGEKT